MPFSDNHFSRSLLVCDQLEFFLLLLNRCMVVSLSSVLAVLSIHPKQRASSTASLYDILFLPVSFLGYSSQISFFFSKLLSSQFLHSCLSAKYLVSVAISIQISESCFKVLKALVRKECYPKHINFISCIGCFFKFF